VAGVSDRLRAACFYYAINKTFSLETVNKYITLRSKKMGHRTQALLARAKRWCDQKYGRQAELAEALGTTRQTVNAWFTGKQSPTSEQTLALLEFLRTKRTKE
jgi:DNA-binding transcriptional regulator YiaG